MIAYSTSSKEIQFWRRYKTFSVHSLPLEALNHSHPPSSPSCTPVTLTPSFWLARLYFMPRKSQSLLWSHGGIAQQWKNIATRKICLTVFKMPGRANSPYQSLCKGIRPGPQIPLFLISLGLFSQQLGKCVTGFVWNEFVQCQNESMGIYKTRLSSMTGRL